MDGRRWPWTSRGGGRTRRRSLIRELDVWMRMGFEERIREREDLMDRVGREFEGDERRVG